MAAFGPDKEVIDDREEARTEAEGILIHGRNRPWNQELMWWLWGLAGLWPSNGAALVVPRY